MAAWRGHSVHDVAGGGRAPGSGISGSRSRPRESDQAELAFPGAARQGSRGWASRRWWVVIGGGQVHDLRDDVAVLKPPYRRHPVARAARASAAGHRVRAGTTQAGRAAAVREMWLARVHLALANQVGADAHA